MLKSEVYFVSIFDKFGFRTFTVSGKKLQVLLSLFHLLLKVLLVGSPGKTLVREGNTKGTIQLRPNIFFQFF